MAGKLLNDQITGQVRQVFDQLKEPVQILFFGNKRGCDYCGETLQLVKEIIELSPKLSLTQYDIEDNAAVAEQYHIDKVPGLVIAGKQGEQIRDYGIRISGIPSGHEFSSLIHDLVLVSGGDSGLDPKTREYLKSLTKPVHLQVFVTPTWPYCPRAVVLAHQMAMESPYIQAEMIEAMEFPELSERHGVSGVPQTTINDGAAHVVGAVTETQLIAEIQRALRGRN